MMEIYSKAEGQKKSKTPYLIFFELRDYVTPTESRGELTLTLPCKLKRKEGRKQGSKRGREKRSLLLRRRKRAYFNAYLKAYLLACIRHGASLLAYFNASFLLEAISLPCFVFAVSLLKGVP
jgi:hypothetical protein